MQDNWPTPILKNLNVQTHEGGINLILLILYEYYRTFNSGAH